MHHFTQQTAQIDWPTLQACARTATRFLDNIIDVSQYPLTAQRHEAKGSRRIGLGITGLGDALVMLGIKYGDAPSIALTSKIMKISPKQLGKLLLNWRKKKAVFLFTRMLIWRANFLKI